VTRLALLAALALASCDAAAVRIVGQRELAYELSLADVTLPARASAIVSFRSCTACRSAARRVDAATRYLVDGREVGLDDFLAAAARLREPRAAEDDVFVGVYVDEQSQLVLRIALHRRKH
jgi:hypothetical protein